MSNKRFSIDYNSDMQTVLLKNIKFDEYDILCTTESGLVELVLLKEEKRFRWLELSRMYLYTESFETVQEAILFYKEDYDIMLYKTGGIYCRGLYHKNEREP